MELAKMIDKQELEDPGISALKNQLLSSVPADGSIENEALVRRLGWDGKRYRYIRALLVDEGMLRRRGKCVSLRRASSKGHASSVRRAEKDLYAPILETLRSCWIPEKEIHDFVFHVTAAQGRRNTGGKWTRPDIALASSNSYQYVRARPVEIRTFEVKAHDGLDVGAVYEALSHRRAAHYVHVLAHVPEHERNALKPVLERLVGDARTHGVGLITFADPQKYETWRVAAEPRRVDPDPADLEAFIDDQTSDEFRNRIVEWCRRV